MEAERDFTTATYPAVPVLPASDHARDPGRFFRQAFVARALGSSFVGAVLEAGHRQLHRAPATAALIAGWLGDPEAAALAMRFNGALHALARRGTPATLGALYRGEHDDFDAAVGAALAGQDRFVAAWMRHPTQTNEVGRAAAILSALMVVGQQTGLPFELLELGSSSGLNLNLAHYRYDLGGLTAGTPSSPVHIAPDWRGSPPPCGRVEVVSAHGVDLHPLDPTDAATRERLLSYVWADQPDRARRLEAALTLARHHRPHVVQADAISWLAGTLQVPHADGVCRVVFHSMMLQYLDDQERSAVAAMLARAGAGASVRRPLARISFEWTPTRSEVRLLVTCWPGGETLHLASCHPYGDWIDWHGSLRPA